MKTLKAYSLLACAFSLISAGTTYGQIVQNGSFESPAEGSVGVYAVTPDVWNSFDVAGPGPIASAPSGPGQVYTVNGTPYAYPGPEDAQQYALIVGASGGSPFAEFEGLDQPVAIATAGAYTLSWYAASLTPGVQTSYSPDYSAALFDPNGNIINTTDFSYSAGGGWVFNFLTVDLPVGLDNVQFGAWNNDYIFLDNVSLTPVPDGGSALLLLNLSCGALAAFVLKMRPTRLAR